MKPTSTFFLFFCLLTASTTFGQSSLLIGRSNTQFSLTMAAIGGDSAVISHNLLHQPIQYKNWKLDNTGIWSVKSRSTGYIYDAAGNVLFFLKQTGDDVNGWTDTERYTYTFTPDGKQLTYLYEKWNGTSWVTQSNTINVYDANGYLLSSTSAFARYLYAYNAEGLLETTTYQEYPAGSWVNKNLTQYTYLPGDTKVETETSSNWAGAWNEISRLSYTYDASGNTLQTLSQGWNGTAWENYSLELKSYDLSGNLILTQSQQWNGMAWGNYSQTTQNYDAANNLTSWLFETWNAGSWQGFYRQFNGYDAKNNFINARFELSNGTSWVMESYGRLNYLELVSTQTPALAAFELFPNPASTSVTLKGTGLSHAMIFDQNGRLLRSESLQGQETLQVGDLTSGNYLLKVLSNDGKIGAKLLQIRR